VSSNTFVSSVIPNSGKQHDPEDEPVVASLDPDYFDFDREFLSNPSGALTHSVPVLRIQR
jgi:hypothetical protein